MPSLGTPGGSLQNPTFLADARTATAGRAGEQLTAALLDKMAAERGFTVLHDLRTPGAKANIDHIVVAGTSVTVIDSKMWKPGFYFTLGGKTRRGFERVPHCDKAGLPLGHSRVSEMLRSHGLRPRMRNPLMVIHASRTDKPLRLWAYRPASTQDAHVRAITPASLSFARQTADPRIVAALTPYLI